MPTQLLADRVAALYGRSQSLTEVAFKDAFTSGDEAWVFAHPPSLGTLFELLRRHLQDAAHRTPHRIPRREL